MNYEAVYWLIFGLSLIGSALLIHAVESIAPRFERWIAAIRESAR